MLKNLENVFFFYKSNLDYKREGAEKEIEPGAKRWSFVTVSNRR